MIGSESSHQDKSGTNQPVDLNGAYREDFWVTVGLCTHRTFSSATNSADSYHVLSLL